MARHIAPTEAAVEGCAGGRRGRAPTVRDRRGSLAAVRARPPARSALLRGGSPHPAVTVVFAPVTPALDVAFPPVVLLPGFLP